MTSVCPSATPPSTGSTRAARSRSRSSVACTASSSTDTAARRSWISLKSPGSNAGTTSKLAVKDSGLPSSTTTSFTSGVSTGSTPLADST